MHNSEVADPQEVPKNRWKQWALSTHSMGDECPFYGLSMPDAWSLSAHLVVSDCPFNGLRQTTLCAFCSDSGCRSFLLFLVCIDILYILE